MSQLVRPKLTIMVFCSLLSMALTIVHLLGYEQVTWFHCMLPILISWGIGLLILIASIITLLMMKMFDGL